MRNIKLIIAREFSTRIKKKSFSVTIIISVLVILGVIYLPTIISYVSGGSQVKLAVINQTNQTSFGSADLKTYLDASLNTTITATGDTQTTSNSTKSSYVISYPAQSELEETKSQVRDGKLDAVLTITRASNGDLEFALFTAKGISDASNQRINDTATRMSISDRLARLGITQPQQASSILLPANFKVTTTQEEKDTKRGMPTGEYEQLASYFLVLAMIIGLFTSITSYGSIIAQGVAEEKGTRVMEILITAAKPFELLFGKIIGIGLLGILSFGIIAVVAVPAILAQGAVSEAMLGSANSTSPDFSNIGIQMFIYFLVYYILGFFLYATLFAAVGSLCSRVEDVQQAVAPITILLMICYFIAIFGLQAIDAPWVVVCSYIPFFSPILMLARAGFGAVSPIEVIITILLMAVSIVICSWIASRIYRVGILMYGKRTGLMQAIGLSRSAK